MFDKRFLRVALAVAEESVKKCGKKALQTHQPVDARLTASMAACVKKQAPPRRFFGGRRVGNANLQAY